MTRVRAVHPLSAGVKPKPARILTDWGYGDRTRGWYDVQCQGARNDYCRWVGDAPNTWWSCALAGATNQYSPSGAFTQENTRTTVCAAGGLLCACAYCSRTFVRQPALQSYCRHQNSWKHETASSLRRALVIGKGLRRVHRSNDYLPGACSLDSRYSSG